MVERMVVGKVDKRDGRIQTDLFSILSNVRTEAREMDAMMKEAEADKFKDVNEMTEVKCGVIYEQIGELAEKLVEERLKNEKNEHIRHVLRNVPYVDSSSTMGENIESHLIVEVKVTKEEEKNFTLSGKEDHYSGYQHSPGISGREFGSEELVKLNDQPVVVQLCYLYRKYGKLSVLGKVRTEFGSWESSEYWEVDFDFP